MNKYLIDETYKCSNIAGLEAIMAGLRLVLKEASSLGIELSIQIAAKQELKEVIECMEAIRENWRAKSVGGLECMTRGIYD